METPSGNIALTAAILQTVSKAVMAMSEKEYKDEKLYYLSISVAQSMLRKGAISTETYKQIDTKLLEKYRPISGTLLAGIPLT